MRIKILTYLFFSLWVNEIYSQIFDDFGDGDFTMNPVWFGDTENFIVNDVFELQLFDDEGGTSFIYLEAPTADSTRWEFYIRQEFSPSGSNFASVILRSDSPDLSSGFNGYFLKIGGESGDTDALELFRSDDASEVLIWRGDDGDLSSDPAQGRFRITQNNEAIWTIEADYSGGTDFELLGTVEDAVHNSGQYFGFQQTYTSTRADKFYFDDVFIDPLFEDMDPPELLSVLPISGSELEVVFNEPLAQTNAEVLANYTVNQNISNPSSATLLSDQVTVSLTFDQIFTSGNTYVLETQNIADLEGNIAGAQSMEFFFVQPEPGAFKEVVINEIFADPTPSEGLPEAEFVELFNSSTAYFNLSQWQFVNTDNAIDLPDFLLAPGNFIILCDQSETELFESFGTTIGLPSFPALTNSGDSLTLNNVDGELIDVVSYELSWYNDPDKDDGGFSLELINPQTDCSNFSNWSASNSEIGGSPGSQNSIYNDDPDEKPPVLIDYMVQSSSEIVLSFSESMDEQSLMDASYLWTEGVVTQNVTPSEDLQEVLLTLNPSLETGVLYELTIKGPSDCEGNIFNQETIELLIGEFPFAGELVISEIMADPTPEVALPDAEYFELFNAGKRAIEIGGVSLNDLILADSEVLFPGDYLICTSPENLDLFENAYIIEELSPTFFTNSGKELQLKDQTGEQLDYVDYDISWYEDAEKEDGGYSLERKNLLEPCRSSDNWSASENEAGGTPGQENSVNTDIPDKTPPILQVIFVENPLSLILSFNESLDTLNLAEIEISITPELGISTIESQPPEYNSLGLILSEELSPSVVYTITITNLSDCSGNSITTPQELDFGLPENPELGDIILNEILFNPNTGGSDFIEIVNVSERILSIQDWNLSNEDESIQTITSLPLSMFPGDYLVLTKDKQNIIQEYPMGISENIYQMGNTPAYSNGDGSVILLNQDLVEMDRFDYDESFHFELLKTVKGVSLERLSFTRQTNESGNWFSASEQSGFGTPGYLNSQFNPEGSAGSFFELENEIISPDNDGFQDVLLINYSLNEPGSVATIKIFDRRGRQVRELENNLLIGTEGTLTWDGLTDNRTKARIGPHIVYIDVYNANGTTETKKLPCIVAGKFN